MLGDVKTDEVGIGQQLLEFMEEKGLAAADIEDTGVGPETVKINQRLGHGGPRPLDVFVAAVAVAAIAVPVIVLVFLGLEHAMHFVVHHARQIIALRRFVQRRHNVEKLAHELLLGSSYCWPPMRRDFGHSNWLVLTRVSKGLSAWETFGAPEATLSSRHRAHRRATVQRPSSYDATAAWTTSAMRLALMPNVSISHSWLP